MLIHISKYWPGQPGPSAQNESPGKDNEANWLPAPKGPFFMDMRLYWSKEEALGGKWTAPRLKRVE